MLLIMLINFSLHSHFFFLCPNLSLVNKGLLWKTFIDPHNMFELSECSPLIPSLFEAFLVKLIP